MIHHLTAINYMKQIFQGDEVIIKRLSNIISGKIKLEREIFKSIVLLVATIYKYIIM